MAASQAEQLKYFRQRRDQLDAAYKDIQDKKGILAWNTKEMHDLYETYNAKKDGLWDRLDRKDWTSVMLAIYASKIRRTPGAVCWRVAETDLPVGSFQNGAYIVGTNPGELSEQDVRLYACTLKDVCRPDTLRDSNAGELHPPSQIDEDMPQATTTPMTTPPPTPQKPKPAPRTAEIIKKEEQKKEKKHEEKKDKHEQKEKKERHKKRKHASKKEESDSEEKSCTTPPVRPPPPPPAPAAATESDAETDKPKSSKKKVARKLDLTGEDDAKKTGDDPKREEKLAKKREQEKIRREKKRAARADQSTPAKSDAPEEPVCPPAPKRAARPALAESPSKPKPAARPAPSESPSKPKPPAVNAYAGFSSEDEEDVPSKKRAKPAAAAAAAAAAVPESPAETKSTEVAAAATTLSPAPAAPPAPAVASPPVVSTTPSVLPPIQGIRRISRDSRGDLHAQVWRRAGGAASTPHEAPEIVPLIDVPAETAELLLTEVETAILRRRNDFPISGFPAPTITNVAMLPRPDNSKTRDLAFGFTRTTAQGASEKSESHSGSLPGGLHAVEEFLAYVRQKLAYYRTL
jgi:hypothetical protein